MNDHERAAENEKQPKCLTELMDDEPQAEANMVKGKDGRLRSMPITGNMPGTVEKGTPDPDHADHDMPLIGKVAFTSNRGLIADIPPTEVELGQPFRVKITKKLLKELRRALDKTGGAFVTFAVLDEKVVAAQMEQAAKRAEVVARKHAEDNGYENFKGAGE